MEHDTLADRIELSVQDGAGVERYGVCTLKITGHGISHQVCRIAGVSLEVILPDANRRDDPVIPELALKGFDRGGEIREAQVRCSPGEECRMHSAPEKRIEHARPSQVLVVIVDIRAPGDAVRGVADV